MSGWERDLNRAFEMVQLAGVYIDDGALLTAAGKLEQAAELVKLAHGKRERALNRAIGVGK